MGKRILWMCMLGLLLFSTGCVEKNTFKAQVLEIEEGGLLLAPAEGEEICRSADRIFTSTQDISLPSLQPGDWVYVTYTGGVRESYPAQVDAQQIKIASP